MRPANAALHQLRPEIHKVTCVMQLRRYLGPEAGDVLGGSRHKKTVGVDRIDPIRIDVRPHFPAIQSVDLTVTGTDGCVSLLVQFDQGCYVMRVEPIVIVQPSDRVELLRHAMSQPQNGPI